MLYTLYIITFIGIQSDVGRGNVSTAETLDNDQRWGSSKHKLSILYNSISYLNKDDKETANIERISTGQYNNKNNDDYSRIQLIIILLSTLGRKPAKTQSPIATISCDYPPPQHKSAWKRLQTIIITTAAAHRYVIIESAPRRLFDKFSTSFYCRRHILRFYTDFSSLCVYSLICVYVYCGIIIVVSSVCFIDDIFVQ